MIDVVIENEQVLYMDNYNDGLSCLDIDQLVQSIADGHEQIRICTHISKNNLLHEMIIVDTNKVYVRPHRHIGKSESMHIIDGTAGRISIKLN